MTDSAGTSGGRGHAVVVGGGVIGLACAEYLSEADFRVTVVDRGRVGGACSHGNCGFVCPSHVLPLTEPGIVGQAVRSMLKPGSPLKVNPGLSPARWRWMWRFLRRCNEADMRSAGHAIQPLLLSSYKLYEQWVADGIDCDWRRRGLMFAYRTKAAFEAYAATDRLLRDEYAEPAERLEGDAVRDREPALRKGLAGGWYFEHDAHLRPDKLIRSLADRLRGRGVGILEDTAVTSLRTEGGRVTGVVCGGRTLDADELVVATGAWTPRLKDVFGVDVPIQPGKGYSVLVRPEGPATTVPLIFPETRVAVTPFEDSVRLGSMMEIGNESEAMPAKRLRLLRTGSQPFLDFELPAETDDHWYGWRPMTSDSVPYIGPAGNHANLTLATGHNMLGLSMAPATGKLVAELLTGEEPHLDVTPYAMERPFSVRRAA